MATSNLDTRTPYRIMPECDNDDDDDADEDPRMSLGLAALLAPVGGDPMRSLSKGELVNPSLMGTAKSKAVATLVAINEWFAQEE